jgi:hypothetical protein
MRTRTRTPIKPAGCRCESLTETFTDDPHPAKIWKPCYHKIVTVDSFTRPSVRTVTQSHYLPPRPPTITNYPLGGNFPKYLGNWGGTFRGYTADVPPLAQSVTLPEIDLDQVVLELSRSSTNLAEIAATFVPTVALFSGPGRFLKHWRKSERYQIGVSRRPLKELRASLDRAGETWLAGTYGYIPLLSDLVELTRICRDPIKVLKKLKEPVTKNIRQSASLEVSSTENPLRRDYDFSYRWTDKVTRSRLIRLNGTPNPSFQSLSLANQMATYLGLADFGRLAWELVPFSFVFDWFSSLGASVASAQALNGHYAYCDMKVSSAVSTKTVRTYTPRPSRKSSYFSTQFNFTQTCDVAGGLCTVRTEEFSRSSYGEGDTSGSTFHNGLSAYRTTTGLALLLGQMRHLTGW